ncbi:hypothetical protein GCM10020000_13760 [Streptomyces olivoverticillatus]
MPSRVPVSDRSQRPAQISPKSKQAGPPSALAPPGSAPSLLALQRTAGNGAVLRMLQAGGASREQSAVPEALRGGGHPLDAATRNDMEARLGADLSGVRVHTDAAAQRSAREIGARAYTARAIMSSSAATERTRPPWRTSSRTSSSSAGAKWRAPTPITGSR